MITLSIALFLSVMLNILLVWYCRRLTGQFVFFADSVGQLGESLSDFDAHLRGVHELEMFYGDETLESLIGHSRAVVDNIGDFYQQFSLEDQEEEGEIDGSA